MEREDDIEVGAATRLQVLIGQVLMRLGNWIFVRWAAALLCIKKPTTSDSLYLALIRDEMIDEHGVDGLARIVGFHDTYLSSED